MAAALDPLPPRDPHGHKGSFGTVGVIGGQCASPHTMIGGPAFAALAALRSGAGLAVLAVPAPIMNAGLVIAPSATGIALAVDARDTIDPEAAAAVLAHVQPAWDCSVVGPGFGVGSEQAALLRWLIDHEGPPLVMDADALNTLATFEPSPISRAALLTPHPGEWRRLANACGVSGDPVDPARRPEAAQTLARSLHAVVVLKGARTVIASEDDVHVDDTVNAALATAGTGDVLSGVVASFVAQFHGPRRVSASLFQCACWAVAVHGRAAARWSAAEGDAGMLATDLLALLPAAVTAARSS